jgi:2-dehydropantoate 2-reductase
MRICVYGAGAVGGHLAVRLAAAGNEVSVLARGRNLAAIRQRGISLRSGDQTLVAHPKASEDPSQLGPQDFVIVTLKANALGVFAQSSAPLLHPGTGVVFAQNGIPWWYAMGLSGSRPRPPDLSRLDPGGALDKAVAPERIIGAVVYSANDLVEPGLVVNHTHGNNMLVVGECDDAASPRISNLRAVLEQAGISSPATADIRQAVWNKAIINLGTGAVCILSGEAIAAVRADPALQGLLTRTAQEGKVVALAHGVDPDRAPQRPSGGHKSGAISHKPSILVDYELGRPMEIEAQLAAPHAFARAAGVATPTLDALVPLAAHKAAAKGLHKT